MNTTTWLFWIWLGLNLTLVGIPGRAAGDESIHLLANINDSAVSDAYNVDPGAVEYNGAVYFASSDPAHGVELWRTDGTDAGTGPFLDLQPGTNGSYPSKLTVSGGKLYFVAYSFENGNELYVSDGSVAGTTLLKDIYPGTGSSSPTGFTEYNGKLYFLANDGVHGYELWQTDGTEAGTVLCWENSGSSSDTLVVYNGLLYWWVQGRFIYRTDGTPAVREYLTELQLSAKPLVHAGKLWFGAYTWYSNYEPWFYDGTSFYYYDLMGTSWGYNYGSYPDYFIEYDGYLYFRAYSDSYGYEWWRHDGASLTLAADIEPGTGSSYPSYPLLHNHALYFNAYTSASGYELWRFSSPGGAPELVADLEPGTSNSNAYPLVSTPAGLIVAAYTSGGGYEPYLAQNGVSGLTLIADLYPGSGSSLGWSSVRTTLGGRALFYANDASHSGLWVSDGTGAGTRFLRANVSGDNSSSPDNFVSFDGGALFAATHPLTGREWYKTDGSLSGASLVSDATPGPDSSPITRPVSLGPAVVYSVWDGNSGNYLPWRTDGTAAGTYRLTGVDPYPVPYEFTVHNGKAYFGASSSAEGYELWATDGTVAGTQLVADIEPGSGSSSPYGFRSTSGGLYFQANTSANGQELWRTDGTPGGTVLVADVEPGAASSYPYQATEFNGYVYFNATTAAAGQELWRTNGTPGNFELVADLAPGTGSSGPSSMTVANGVLFFAASDNVHGLELWRTDGALGATLVRDINPGKYYSNPQNLMPFENGILFQAWDNAHGTELWFSDGTETGTRLIKDIVPGVETSNPMGFQVLKGAVYFRAYTPESGNELWRTDGTRLGTYQVADLAPGAASSDAVPGVVKDGVLYFPAYEPITGREPYYLTVTPSVHLDQGESQADPATELPLVFEAHFSEPVTGFDDPNADLLQTGTATGVSFTITPIDSLAYRIEATVDGSPGTVAPVIPEGAAMTLESVPTPASTSVDGVVTYLPSIPEFNRFEAVPPLASHGQAVTLTFWTTEAPSSLTVTVNGHAAGFVGNSGLQYTYSYIVQQDDPTGYATISVEGQDAETGLPCRGSDRATLFIATMPSAEDEWVKTMGTSGDEEFSSVIADSSNNAYAVGTFSGTVDMDPGPGVVNLISHGGSDACVAKYAPDGFLLWALGWGGTAEDRAFDIFADPDGNLYITGRVQGNADLDPTPGVYDTTPFSPSEFDAFLIKLDRDGNFLWARRWGGNGHTDGMAVAASNIGAVVTGSFTGTSDFDPGPGTNSATANYVDTYVSAFNPNGQFRWVRIIGGNGQQYVTDLAMNYDYSVIVAGFFESTLDINGFQLSNNGLYDAYLINFDLGTSAVNWGKSWGGSGNDYATGLATGGWYGYLYVAGLFNGTIDADPGSGTTSLSSQGLDDISVSTFSNYDGSFVAARSFGGAGDDSGYVACNNDTLILSGRFTGSVDFDPSNPGGEAVSFGSRDSFVCRLNISSLNCAWVRTGGSSGSDGSQKACIANDGYIYSVGSIKGPATFHLGSRDESVANAGANDGYIARMRARVSVTLSTTEPDPTNATAFSVTATFSDPVTGFSLYGIQASNAYIDNFAGSGTTYTFDVHPASEGIVDLYLPAGAAYDISNGYTATSPHLVRTVDWTGPSVEIGNPDVALTTSGPVSFEVLHSGYATLNFSTSDVTLQSTGTASAAAFEVQGNKTVLTGLSGDGTLAPLVQSGTAADLAGNLAPSAGPGPLVVVDNTGPDVGSVQAVPNLAGLGQAVSISVTASETLAADPTLSVNGHSATYSGHAGLVYHFLYHVTGSDPEGFATIQVSANDLAGNPGSATDTTALQIDLTPPQFTGITAEPSEASQGTRVTIRFQTSEESDPEVTVNGHLAIPAARKADLAYEYIVQRPDIDPLGPATIQISGADAAGNVGVATSVDALAIVPDAAFLPVAAWPAGLLLVALGAWTLRRKQS